MYYSILFSPAPSTVGVQCVTGDVRLASSSDDTASATREGKLEVCINDAWGAVCADLFDTTDAQVFCDQLKGFQKDG